MTRSGLAVGGAVIAPQLLAVRGDDSGRFRTPRPRRVLRELAGTSTPPGRIGRRAGHHAGGTSPSRPASLSSTAETTTTTTTKYFAKIQPSCRRASRSRPNVIAPPTGWWPATSSTWAGWKAAVRQIPNSRTWCPTWSNRRPDPTGEYSRCPGRRAPPASPQPSRRRGAGAHLGGRPVGPGAQGKVSILTGCATRSGSSPCPKASASQRKNTIKGIFRRSFDAQGAGRQRPIHQFTGNEVRPARSRTGRGGDASPGQRRPGHGEPRHPLRRARFGGTLWFDAMQIPRAPPAPATSPVDELRLRPANTAQITAAVQFIPPVQGVQSSYARWAARGAALAGNPLLVPDDATGAAAHVRNLRRPGRPSSTRFSKISAPGLERPGTREKGRRARPTTRRCDGAAGPRWASRSGIIWLLLFFLVPVAMLLLKASLSTKPSRFENPVFWNFSNYADASASTNPSSSARSSTGTATVLAIVIGVRWPTGSPRRAVATRTCSSALVVVPFFTSYLIRTIAWTSILRDDGPFVSMYQLLPWVGDDGRILATPWAVIGGLTYNSFVHDPAHLREPGRSTSRLTEAAADLGSTAWGRSARWCCRCRCPACSRVAAGVHPARVTTSTTATWDRPDVDDRHRRAEPVPGAGRLPTGRLLSMVLMVIITVLVLIYSPVPRHGRTGRDDVRRGRRHARPRTWIRANAGPMKVRSGVEVDARSRPSRARVPGLFAPLINIVVIFVQAGGATEPVVERVHARGLVPAVQGHRPDQRLHAQPASVGHRGERGARARVADGDRPVAPPLPPDRRSPRSSWSCR